MAASGSPIRSAEESERLSGYHTLASVIWHEVSQRLDSSTRPLTVEVVEANEADFVRSGGMAKLSGWLCGAEAEQSRGLSTRLAVADE